MLLAAGCTGGGDTGQSPPSQSAPTVASPTSPTRSATPDSRVDLPEPVARIAWQVNAQYKPLTKPDTALVVSTRDRQSAGRS